MQLYDVAGYHLRGLIQGFAALGLDVDAVLREAQVARAALDDPETRFVEPQMMQLWLAAERRWGGGEPFGLIVGTHIPFGALELIDYLAAACADLSEGVETLVRYADLCASGFHYSLDPGATDDGNAMRLRLHHRYGIEAVPPSVIDCPASSRATPTTCFRGLLRKPTSSARCARRLQTDCGSATSASSASRGA